MPTGPSSEHPRIAVALLGEPRWWLSDGEAVLLSPLDAVLLALLALEGPQSRDALAGQLWPTADLKRATNNLRQHIRRLRTASDCELFQAGASIRLTGDMQFDLHNLNGLAPEKLLADDLLAGCDYTKNEFLQSWVTDRRQRLHRERADALANHAEALERRGELAAALRLAERIVELAPQQEHAWRRLMRLHYLRGDHTAAIAAFERFEARQRDDTGGKPGAETVALLATIERANASVPTARRIVPVSLKHPPVRVGRTHEWAAMQFAWSTGRAFVLFGEAGIGKSRLLSDWAREQPGALLDRARAGDSQAPYAVLARLLQRLNADHAPLVDDLTRRELARIAPVFGPAPATQAAEATLRHAVETLLKAAMLAGLSALLIDDLHFSDLATLETLRWLSASPALAKLRVGIASRPLDGGALDGMMRDWLVDSHRPDQIDVQALAVEDVDQLLPSLGLQEFVLPGLGRRLHVHAGGHPLFTLETLGDAWLHGHDLRSSAPLPSPQRVQTLLDRRLRDLPQTTLDLLRVAAIAGADLNVERAAHMLGCSVMALAEPWTQLEQANVLRGHAFVHDLVRDSAMQLIPAALAQALHAALARLLANDAAVPAVRVAEHWQAAQAWGEAGPCWHAAAMAARLAGRLVEQQALLQRAAECFRRAGNTTGEFVALHARADALLICHGGKAVLDMLPTLRTLATTALQRLQCDIAEAEALIDHERWEDAEAVAGQAVAAATDHGSLLPDALCLLSMAQVWCRRVDAGIASARRAVTMARRCATPSPQELRTVSSLAYVLYASGRLGESLEVQHQSYRLAETLGDRAEAAAADGNVAGILAAMGDVPGSYEHAGRAWRAYQDMGLSTDSSLGSVTLTVLGMAAAALGEFSEALDTLQSAVQMAGRNAPLSAQAKARLALAGVWLTLGRAADARDLVADLSPETQPGMRVQAELIMARAAAMEGTSGQTHFEHIAELLEQHPALPLVQSAWVEWSHQGETVTVVSKLQSVRAEMESFGLPGLARTVRLREVARLADAADAASAALAAEHAAALLPHVERGLSAKSYPPEAWSILAQAFARADDVKTARQCTKRARAWIDRALARIPQAYRRSFLEVNPFNRQCLAP